MNRNTPPFGGRPPSGGPDDVKTDCTAPSPGAALSPSPRTPLPSGRGVTVLCVVAALAFFATGSGMLEGHAVYPSWRTLAAFDGFAEYHAEYGRALLPWLPLPLILSTIGVGWLVFRRPAGVPRSLVIAALCGQLIVLIVTGLLAVPIQAELASPGHSPDEIVALVDRLIAVNYLREIPGLAVAAAFVVMLALAIRGRTR